jgi:hypothetical protein
MIVSSFGELTWILMQHVPKAYALHLSGQLTETRCWNGSRPFFYFSKNHNELSSKVTYLDSANIYEPTWKCPGVPPNYKEFFKNYITTDFALPPMIINNKFIEEWNKPPVNYIDVPVLEKLIDILQNKYTIIYIRAHTNESGYFNDNQPSHAFRDYDMIRATFPNVVCFNDVLTKSTNSYNELQLMMHSICDKFISIAGGNAVISSYFGGENLIYRSTVARSDGRKIWHSDSHLEQLSGCKIFGYNDPEELINKAKEWI